MVKFDGSEAIFFISLGGINNIEYVLHSTIQNKRKKMKKKTS